MQRNVTAEVHCGRNLGAILQCCRRDDSLTFMSSIRYAVSTVCVRACVSVRAQARARSPSTEEAAKRRRVYIQPVSHACLLLSPCSRTRGENIRTRPTLITCGDDRRYRVSNRTFFFLFCFGLGFLFHSFIVFLAESEQTPLAPRLVARSQTALPPINYKSGAVLPVYIKTGNYT